MTRYKIKKDAPIDRCALCQDKKILSNSHIIPNAYFRAMKRLHNGLVGMVDTNPDSDIDKGAESWDEYLLCADCENVCGRLETFWIPRLREAGKQFNSLDAKIDLKGFEYHSFRRFLLSILWRSSVSKQEEFIPARLTPAVKEMLRQMLLAQDKAPDEGILATRVRKMFEPTGQLTLEVLEHVVMAPVRFIEDGILGLRYLFAGYAIDITLEELDAEQTASPGYVLSKSSYQIPTISVIDIPEFMEVGWHMVLKSENGQARFA